jgi:hypothetical protein
VPKPPEPDASTVSGLPFGRSGNHAIRLFVFSDPRTHNGDFIGLAWPKRGFLGKR